MLSRRDILKMFGAAAAAAYPLSRAARVQAQSAQLYLGKWEWVEPVGDIPHWRAPGGNALGALDLRSLPHQGVAGGNPEGFGLFAYASPQRHSHLLESFGSDMSALLTKRQKGLLRDALALPAGAGIEDRMTDAARQMCFDPSCVDAAGNDRWKPLRCHPLTKLAGVHVGPIELFPAEVVDAKHLAFENMIAVFQVDYERNRHVYDPVTIRKWTGDHMLVLFNRLAEIDADVLIPRRHRNVGFQVPTTTFTETWPTNSTDITTGQDQPWTEDNGDSSVNSNKIGAVDTAVNVVGRCTTNLSSDSHKHTATIDTVQTTNNLRAEVCCRKEAGTALTMYACGFRRQATAQRRLNKYVTNSLTVLSSDTGTDAGTAVSTYVQATGSEISGQIGAQGYSASDSAITGNLQTAFLFNCAANPQDCTMDGHTMEDITGAAPTILPGLLNNPIRGGG
jgi:hypothetical protein